MSQQSFGMRAGPSAYSMESRDDRNVDNSPSDVQPPGVDVEDDEPQSLEEALTG